MNDKQDQSLTDSVTQSDAPVPRYSWYALTVLVIIYVLNFVDRQILSILANDIKADLGIDDAYLGFLYGTAFAIFYALFGIPLGRLADSWKRVRLMTFGLTLWSAMTIVSGLARDATTLTFARVGVGVGEASASPSAYSLISDWFPARLRATALAIYSSGIYIGGGISLLIGGKIVDSWNHAYPDGGPFDLAGWQVAFIAVGLPGLLLALWVITLREPIRGEIDGIVTPEDPHPFRGFVEELLTVIPPFTIIGAARRGPIALLINLSVLIGLLGMGLFLTAALGSGQGKIVGYFTNKIQMTDQWLLLAVGYYAVFCWAANLRKRDYPTFSLTVGSPAFLCTIFGYGTVAFMSYAASYWTAPYAERAFDVSKSFIGLWIGGPSAAFGFLGVILGGRLADIFSQKHASGRLFVVMFGLLTPIPLLIWQFTTQDLMTFLVLAALTGMLASSALGAAAASSQALVLPRMRGTATAAFFLATTMFGLALGPFFAGYISAQNAPDAAVLIGKTAKEIAKLNAPSLAQGLLSILWMAPVGFCLVVAAIKLFPEAGKSLVARARAAGEPI